MTRTWPTRFMLAIVTLAFAASAAQAQLGATVTNWPVPWSSSGSSGRGIRTHWLARPEVVRPSIV